MIETENQSDSRAGSGLGQYEEVAAAATINDNGAGEIGDSSGDIGDSGAATESATITEDGLGEKSIVEILYSSQFP